MEDGLAEHLHVAVVKSGDGVTEDDRSTTAGQADAKLHARGALLFLHAWPSGSIGRSTAPHVQTHATPPTSPRITRPTV